MAFHRITILIVFLTLKPILTEDVEPDYLEMLFSTGNYDEFAKLLKIENVDMIKPHKGDFCKNPLFHKELKMGDILMEPKRGEEARQGLNFDVQPESKWDRYIPYAIIRSNYTAEQRSKITEAISMWNKDVQYLKWMPRTRRNKDYVVFFSGNGCYSQLGRTGGAQALSLQARGCLYTGTIHHEMMHAAGLTHEHNRPDRDEHLRLIPGNIHPDWLPSYEKKSEPYFSVQGPYDFYSLLHYPVVDPDTGRPAFEILDSGVDEKRVGQRDEMTAEDKRKVAQLYGS